ncbi:MAG: TipAS antibiotic-recognition domain-containing protein [Chloroflexi bacterium]|nr:TipAS antibiotic-recognition domain-containing protein [Chloroflexota bacterium]
MGKKKLFKQFSDKEQKHNERLARLEYGPDNVNESVRRWEGYSKKQREAIMDEGNHIYTDIVKAIETRKSPHSEVVQTLLARWHQHIRHFYEPTTEILRGLGDLYNDNPDFAANFRKMHPDLAQYMREGIGTYVDTLETTALQQMLDDDTKSRGA